MGTDGGSPAGDSVAAASARQVIDAWAAAAPGLPSPARIAALKAPRGTTGKSAVYHLGPVGPGGVQVVAKELLSEAAEVECAVYCDLLPRLSVHSPALLGRAPSSDPGRTWLFLEAVTGVRFDDRCPAHVSAATRWLATFHAEAIVGGRGIELPLRNRGFYRQRLDRAAAGIGEACSDPAMSPDDVATLRRVASQLETAREGWIRLTDGFHTVPTGVAHGDFSGRNMAFSERNEKSELKVFDWSEAHRGPIAADLWAADRGEYQLRMEECGMAFSFAEITSWWRLGMLLRLISSVFWEIPKLRHGSSGRPMRRIALYEQALRESIQGRLVGYGGSAAGS